jgi:hypothetical protein
MSVDLPQPLAGGHERPARRPVDGKRAASLLQAAHGMLATMTTQLTPQLARTLVQERGRRLPPRRTAVRWRTGRRARDDLAPDHVASPAAYGA